MPDLYTSIPLDEHYEFTYDPDEPYTGDPGFLEPEEHLGYQIGHELLYPDLSRLPAQYTGDGYAEFLVWEVAREFAHLIGLYKSPAHYSVALYPLRCRVYEPSPHRGDEARQYDPYTLTVARVGDGLIRAWGLTILYEHTRTADRRGLPEVWGVTAELSVSELEADGAEALRAYGERAAHLAYRLGTVEGGTLIPFQADSPALAAPSPGLECARMNPAGALYHNPYDVHHTYRRDAA